VSLTILCALSLAFAVAFWLRLERLIRHVIGRRMEEGTTPETDKQLDQLTWLRAPLARRLVN
jgi:hypothetical protein